MKNQNLKNDDAAAIASAIFQTSQFAIDDLDTAMALVEINKKITNSMKLNEEAVNKVVVYTEAEKQYEPKIKELTAKITKENQTEIEAEIEKFKTENKLVLDSIHAKNKKFEELTKEIGEKPFKIDLPTIDKAKLPKGLKLWQYAALQPIFKTEK